MLVVIFNIIPLNLLFSIIIFLFYIVYSIPVAHARGYVNPYDPMITPGVIGPRCKISERVFPTHKIFLDCFADTFCYNNLLQPFEDGTRDIQHPLTQNLDYKDCEDLTHTLINSIQVHGWIRNGILDTHQDYHYHIKIFNIYKRDCMISSTSRVNPCRGLGYKVCHNPRHYIEGWKIAGIDVVGIIGNLPMPNHKRILPGTDFYCVNCIIGNDNCLCWVAEDASSANIIDVVQNYTYNTTSRGF